MKILICDDCKYVKYIYKMMLLDLAELPNKINWAWLVKEMGFYDVWLNQAVGNIQFFKFVSAKIK